LIYGFFGGDGSIVFLALGEGRGLVSGDGYFFEGAVFIT
jgi:hypothetical protein